jgi:hypothetical protein
MTVERIIYLVTSYYPWRWKMFFKYDAIYFIHKRMNNIILKYLVFKIKLKYWINKI